uniref:Dymeclin n=1 Tax=Lygus hesperus TaxID=30085 RepID=A0A0A9Z6C0_LYGHE
MPCQLSFVSQTHLYAPPPPYVLGPHSPSPSPHSFPNSATLLPHPVMRESYCQLGRRMVLLVLRVLCGTSPTRASYKPIWSTYSLFGYCSPTISTLVVLSRYATTAWAHSATNPSLAPLVYLSPRILVLCTLRTVGFLSIRRIYSCSYLLSLLCSCMLGGIGRGVAPTYSRAHNPSYRFGRYPSYCHLSTPSSMFHRTNLSTASIASVSTHGQMRPSTHTFLPSMAPVCLYSRTLPSSIALGSFSSTAIGILCCVICTTRCIFRPLLPIATVVAPRMVCTLFSIFPKCSTVLLSSILPTYVVGPVAMLVRSTPLSSLALLSVVASFQTSSPPPGFHFPPQSTLGRCTTYL